MPANTKAPLLYASLIGLSAVFGIMAAFALTVEKLNALANPGAPAACDINPLVQCGANLSSWQGALFGFPNPLLGLLGWPVVLTVAVLIASRVSLPNWFMRAYSAGISAAFVFVVWLMYASFFQVGTLCPWCMVTWIATIPAFVLTWAYGLRNGIWGKSEFSIRLGETIWFWSPSIILLIVAIAAGTAEVQLSWIRAIF